MAVWFRSGNLTYDVVTCSVLVRTETPGVADRLNCSNYAELFPKHEDVPLRQMGPAAWELCLWAANPPKGSTCRDGRDSLPMVLCNPQPR